MALLTPACPITHHSLTFSRPWRILPRCSPWWTMLGYECDDPVRFHPNKTRNGMEKKELHHRPPSSRKRTREIVASAHRPVRYGVNFETERNTASVLFSMLIFWLAIPPPLFTWTAADGVLSTNMATRRHFVTNQMHILRRFISAAALPRRGINSSKNKKRKEKKKKRQNEMK